MFFSKLFKCDANGLSDSEREEFIELMAEYYECVEAGFKKAFNKRIQNKIVSECDAYLRKDLNILFARCKSTEIKFSAREIRYGGGYDGEYMQGIFTMNFKNDGGFGKLEKEINMAMIMRGYRFVDCAKWFSGLFDSCERLLDKADVLSTYKGDYERLQELAIKAGLKGFADNACVKIVGIGSTLVGYNIIKVSVYTIAGDRASLALANDY